MKKQLIALVTGMIILTSCGGDSREEEIETSQVQAVTDSIPTITGEFIYLADAAVLKGRDFIYGVQLDSTAMDLVEKIKSYKRDDFDMIPITVKAKIIPNPQRNGWDEVIQIREVLELPEIKPDSVNKNPN